MLNLRSFKIIHNCGYAVWVFLSTKVTISVLSCPRHVVAVSATMKSSRKGQHAQKGFGPYFFQYLSHIPVTFSFAHSESLFHKTIQSFLVLRVLST